VTCYDRLMRISIALFAAALCACGPAPKPEGPLVPEGSAAPETCCCKSTPMTSVDGLPVYEPGSNRMECSTKQGTCVDDVQCQGKAEESPPPPPPVESDPTSAPIQ
jgi:hypothetical protein